MSESAAIVLHEAGRIPSPGDNCAIAVRRLEAGWRITTDRASIALSHTVLEGHRFAIAPIVAGAALTSWGLPFGRALKAMQPGDYVCNATMIEALRTRHVEFVVPVSPNFSDYFQPYELDERAFRPAEQIPLYDNPRTFSGFTRGGGRGAGTRNHVVILGTSSPTGSFARVLASKFRDAPKDFPNVDGVVAIAHTEGGEAGRPNNFETTLRTLAGFLVNPNVGAVLAADHGTELVNNDALKQWMRDHGYPLDSLAHRFLRLGKDFTANISEGARIVEALLREANATPRTPQPMRNLKIGLQCGGSDAFSGVSGNPLVGIVTREVVRHGGSANLAETDELMGAEPYVLSKVRDLDTARKFLGTLRRFEERLSWHGVSGQTNPSGGNIFRGLYNIAIKSIGAARKKDPAVRLDEVIAFGEPMRDPGFYFMDSPGNDLESIAGQVAAGCNLILFTTGNGSITNHPFVPTIKVMTNTPRFNLLNRDMDFNAGRYLDGEPMEQLGAEAFDYTLKVASGMKSVGEKAGHSQAQLWREWRQNSAKSLPEFRTRPQPRGEPVKLRALGRTIGAGPSNSLELIKTRLSRPPDGKRVRLIIPTSLCSGQVARVIADKLNEKPTGHDSRYVALPHTEGCGVSGEAIEILERVIAGYAVHPLAERALLLEHGCEKTHNDAIRNFLDAHHMDHSRLGFASIQLDGGIEKVTDKVTRWFESQRVPAPSTTRSDPKSQPETRRAGGQRSLTLGLTALGEVPDPAAAAFGMLAGALARSGGAVVVPQNSQLLQSRVFNTDLFDAAPSPTLSYAGITERPGFHIMEMAGSHLVEALTGLGASGAEVLLVFSNDEPIQSHPLVPTVQVGCGSPASAVDLVLNQADPAASALALAEFVAAVARGERTPRAQADGNVDFQVSRGWLGVST